MPFQSPVAVSNTVEVIELLQCECVVEIVGIVLKSLEHAHDLPLRWRGEKVMMGDDGMGDEGDEGVMMAWVMKVMRGG